MKELDYAKLLSRPERSFPQNKLDSALRNRRILVTGAGGSIGSSLCKRIASSPAEFLGMVGHSELPIFKLQQYFRAANPPVKREYRIVDAGALEMAKALRDWRPDMVIHAAAHKHVGLMENQPAAALENNTQATIRLHDLCSEYDVDFVFISTDKAARPTTFMGASKRLAEAYLLTSSSISTICRFGNVLGSSSSLVDIFRRKIEAGETCVITDPSMKRYFITPNEAVGLVLTASLLCPWRAHSIFTIDMGEQEYIIDVVAKLFGEYGLDSRYALGTPGSGEKVVEDLLNDNETTHSTEFPGILRIDGPLNPEKVRQAIFDAVPARLKEITNGLTA